jgi:hypothetical protein
MSSTQVFEWHAWFRADRKIQVKIKIKSMHIIFFDIKRIVHKEYVLAGQTVNSAYYCDALRRLRENVRRIRSELWRQKNWLLHHDNAPSHTSFFTGEFFTINSMTVVLTHSTFPCFPDWRYNWNAAILTQLRWSTQNRRRCWTPHRTRLPGCIFKKAEALGTMHTRGRGLLWGWWWSVGPKLVFDHMAAPAPEIMDGSLISLRAIRRCKPGSHYFWQINKLSKNHMQI